MIDVSRQDAADQMDGEAVGEVDAPRFAATGDGSGTTEWTECPSHPNTIYIARPPNRTKTV